MWARAAPQALKRYWQQELWRPLFAELLNVPPRGPQPNLARHADTLRSHFDGAAGGGKSQRAELKQALHRQFANLTESSGLLKRR